VEVAGSNPVPPTTMKREPSEKRVFVFLSPWRTRLKKVRRHDLLLQYFSEDEEISKKILTHMGFLGTC
jgi:hypothetical protein